MHPYIKPLNSLLTENSDPDYARDMQRYMKDLFEYFGIRSPQRKELAKQFFREHAYPDQEELEDVVKSMWEQPQREFQYIAMELLHRFAKKAEICRIDLYEHLVVTKSWWDTVDFLAANPIGTHFLRFPDTIKPYTEKWMDSGNIWLQRSALLFQLKYKKQTDLNLLKGYIPQLFGSKEFFINKAIGWILREYSKTDARWVVNFVNDHQDSLANLSKREALKWLENKGLV